MSNHPPHTDPEAVAPLLEYVVYRTDLLVTRLTITAPSADAAIEKACWIRSDSKDNVWDRMESHYEARLASQDRGKRGK